MTRSVLVCFCAFVFAACGGDGGGGNNNINQPGPDTVDLDQGDTHDFTINSVEFTITMTSPGTGTIRATNRNQVDDMLVQVTDLDTEELLLPDPRSTVNDVVLLHPNESAESGSVTIGNGRRLRIAAENVGTSSSPPACARGSQNIDCIQVKNLTIN